MKAIVSRVYKNTDFKMYKVYLLRTSLLNAITFY